MEKLKVNKKIKKQLDELIKDLEKGESKENIIKHHINSTWFHCDEFNNISLDDLIIALYFGYELEKNPEEELLEFYLSETNDSVFENGVNFGIKFTLDKLNIQIKGINE